MTSRTQGILYAWSFIHFEELQATFKSTYSGLVRSAGCLRRPEPDARNMNSSRWYTVRHTLPNHMEGCHSILLIPHPEFNPYAAWPRATVSAFHYSSPSNSAFKAEPRVVCLLQQWKQFCFLLAHQPLTWSLLLLEVMENDLTHRLQEMKKE